METSNTNMMRFLPAGLGIIAVVVAFVAPWLAVEASFGGESQSQSFTLRELIEEDVLVMRWFWISLVGVVLLIASAAVAGDTGKNLAQAGAVLALVLPVRSLFDVFTEEEVAGASLASGWGLWACAVLGALALIASRFMPVEEARDVQPLQRIEQVEQ